MRRRHWKVTGCAEGGHSSKKHRHCSVLRPFSFPLDVDISPPRRVRISEVKDTSFTLTWRSKTDSITGHLIQATPIGGSHAPVSRIIPGDVNTYTLTGEWTACFFLLNATYLHFYRSSLWFCFPSQDLQPGTTYSVSLYTMNGNIKSEPFTLILKTGELNASKKKNNQGKMPMSTDMFFALWL